MALFQKEISKVSVPKHKNKNSSTSSVRSAGIQPLEKVEGTLKGKYFE
jgi:hypothetical protein